MNGKASGAKISESESSGYTILQLFEEADESTRMDMYMSYRNMRESFERVEASTSPRSDGDELTRRSRKLHLF